MAKHYNERCFKQLFAADFETFTPKSKYFKDRAVYDKDNNPIYKKCKTNIYAYSLIRIPVAYIGKEKTYKVNKPKGDRKGILRVNFGWKLADFMNTLRYYKDYNHNRYYKELIVWFHNGHRFDFHFIHAWLQEQDNWEFYIWSDLHYKKHHDDEDDEKEYKKVSQVLKEKYTGKNLYHYEKKGKYVVLDVYMWNEVAGYHVHVDFWDSLLVWKQSVEQIAKDLTKEENKDVLAWIVDNFGIGEDDLRKVKEIDFNNYQDIDDKYIYLSDGIKVPLTTQPSKAHNKIRILYDRVVNDSRIMAAFFAYLIVHNVITVPTQSKLYRTSGSLAIARFTHDYIEQHNIPKEDRYPNVFWNKYIWEVSAEEKEEICKTFRPWLTGGFTSFNEDYLEKMIDNKKAIFSYDVNSLYPWVVSTFELPYGSMTISDEPIDGMYCFVSFECDEITQLLTRMTNMIPKKWINNQDHFITHGKSIPVRTIKGQFTKGYKEQPQYLRHLKGNIQGFLSWKLLKDIYMDKEVFEIKGLRNLRFYCFKTKFYMRDYMLKYYDWKLKAETPAKKETAKLNLNAPTGKLGEKIYRETRFQFGDIFEELEIEDLVEDGRIKTRKEHLDKALENPEEYKNDYVVFEEFKMANHAYYPAYQAITFEARYKTMKSCIDELKKHPDMVICYNDTDSGKGFSDGSLFSDAIVDDKKLGYWKQEFIKKDNKVVKFVVLRAKAWGAQWEKPYDKEKKKLVQVASGGVNPKTVEAALNNDLDNLLKIKEYEVKDSKLTNFGVVLVDSHKEIGLNLEQEASI